MLIQQDTHLPITSQHARMPTLAGVEEVVEAEQPVLNASRQDLRGNETMGESVWKSEEKEGMHDSPNHLTPVRSSNPWRAASAVSRPV